MNNVEELAAALDYPWDKWTIFLHPAQRELVERDFNGPARVAGSAGTGKTIVALHRAVHLARNNRESRVLLTTFSDTLSKRFAQQTSPFASSRTTPRREHRSAFHQCDRTATLRVEIRSAENCIRTN